VQGKEMKVKYIGGNMNNYRHGDLGLFGVNELPAKLAGLKKSTSKILMTGSGGHDHTFAHGEFYLKIDNARIINGTVIGYLVANNRTRLFHPEHGKVVKGKDLREAKIAGGIYELRRQQEDTHDGMRPVED
jgi:hypothetical protein